MKKESLISIAVIDNKLLYYVSDAAKVLNYRDEEAALHQLPDAEVYCIKCGQPGAKAVYATTATGLFTLINHCDLADIPKDWMHTAKVFAPQELLNTQAVSGVRYYASKLALIINPANKPATEETPAEVIYSITEIAAECGMSARKLNLFLEIKGILRKKGNRWIICKKYAKKGYVGYKHNKKQNLYWTPAGKEFILSILKTDGINNNTTS